MNKDRLFFDPCPLAIIKGFIYFLAYLTSVFLVGSKELYYFGVIMYCCGCICDYIEIAAYRDDKCTFVRRIALILAFGLGILGVFALAFLYNLGSNADAVTFFDTARRWINLFLASYWAIPLANGFLLAYMAIRSKKRKKISNNQKHAAGYYFKP